MSENTAVILFITIFLLAVAVGIVILVLIYQKKQIQNLHEKKQLKDNFEREILSSRLEIQEQTFSNISQEIHDNIGQVLSLARLTINSIECTDEKMNEKITSTSQLVGKAIQDLRDLSKSLHTGNIADIGLVNAIKNEIEIIRRAGNFEVSFEQEGLTSRLPDQQELILFRTFQEVMNNIIKHSGATHIRVAIHHAADRFALEVEDNGKGFDPSLLHTKHPESSGLGIMNMRNRTRIIGAELMIDTSQGKGTRIRIELGVVNRES